MNLINDGKNISIAIFEWNPKLRNKNNVISFICKKNIPIEYGCSISSITGIYEIQEVIENRPSRVTGFNYVTAKTSFKLTKH